MVNSSKRNEIITNNLFQFVCTTPDNQFENLNATMMQHVSFVMFYTRGYMLAI